MGILKDYTEAVALGDVKDKLRSLKYKETSGTEPYIQKDIPFGINDPGFQYNQINARTTDVERFAKILTSKPGLKFQANQALLQQVDQTSKLKKAAGGGFKSLLKAVGKQALKTVTNNIAKTASILAQVPVNGTGTHFLINISPDTYLSDGAGPTTGLGRFLRDVGIGGGVNGGKSALAGESIGTPILDSGGIQADTVLFGNEKETLLSRQQSLGAQKAAEDFLGFANFQVPPLSNPTVNPIQLGISKLPSLGKKLLSKNKPPNVPNLSNDFTEYLGKELVTGAATGKDGVSPLPKIISTQVARDRKILENKLETEGTTTVDTDPNTVVPLRGEDKYNGVDIKGNYLTDDLYIQSKYRLGDQGNKNSAERGVDFINRLSVQQESILNDEDKKDIVPFEFNIFEPGRERFLYFRAFLDTLNDNYTGDWSGTKYIGRAEQFYTYQGFDRTIDFSFKIAALSKQELLPLYQKLNFLVGSTAPSYTSNGEFMKGTLCALTIGDYISRQDGFISSIGITWDKTYPWEINNNAGKEGLKPRVPHMLDINVSFTPIHRFNVKSNLDLENNETYIGGNRMKEFGQPSVEVGEGAFGGPFDQGGFVDIGG